MAKLQHFKDYERLRYFCVLYLSTGWTSTAYQATIIGLEAFMDGSSGPGAEPKSTKFSTKIVG